MSDEPVAYLGGDQGGAEKPPADDEVDGYLGGQSEEESLPSLPPQESHESYSSKDFLGTEAPPTDDPYADPYAEQAPAEGYGDYEGYDAASAEGGDAAYFDSMGHSGVATDDGAPSGDEYAEDYPAGDDPDQPKTISQQDAESIIRRITTKRILPPESTGDKKVAVSPAPKLTEAGGGVRIGPILIALLLIAAMGLYFFGEQLAEQFPELRPALFWLGPVEAPPVMDIVDTVDPNVVAKKKLLDMVLASEAKAFGLAVKDVPAAPPLAAPGGAGTGAPGAAPTTTSPAGQPATTTGGGQ